MKRWRPVNASLWSRHISEWNLVTWRFASFFLSFKAPQLHIHFLSFTSTHPTFDLLSLGRYSENAQIRDWCVSSCAVDAFFSSDWLVYMFQRQKLNLQRKRRIPKPKRTSLVFLCTVPFNLSPVWIFPSFSERWQDQASTLSIQSVYEGSPCWLQRETSRFKP